MSKASGAFMPSPLSSLSPMNNVLITSAAAKVPLVQAFREALGEGGKVFTADLAADCAAAHFSDGHFVVRPSTAADAVDHLIDLCVRHQVGLVVPTRDGELAQLAAARHRFADAGIFVHVASAAVIGTCQDKRAFTRFLIDHDLPAVPLVDCRPADMMFPVFVRPVFGSAGRGAQRVDRLEDLEALSRSEEVLIHPLIQAPEYSIDLLMDLDGRNALDAVCRERVQVVAGESKISRVVDLPEMTGIVKRIGETLGLVGHNTLQAFLDPVRGPLVIEVNPRFGGASNLSIRAGLDSPRRIIQMMRGDGAASEPRKIAVGATMFRYPQDVIVGA